MQNRQPPHFFWQETAPGDRLRSAEFRSNSFERCRGGGVYFGELSGGTEMHIATWLVAVPWRNSFIGAFSGEFQNLRSDASSGKRTSAVRAPIGQLPSKSSLASTTSSTSPPYLAIAALVFATSGKNFSMSWMMICPIKYAAIVLCLLTGRVGIVWMAAERCRDCMRQVRIERLYV